MSATVLRNTSTAWRSVFTEDAGSGAGDGSPAMQHVCYHHNGPSNYVSMRIVYHTCTKKCMILI
jgi:hypothetical protein